jgi:hypothetical protein
MVVSTTADAGLRMCLHGLKQRVVLHVYYLLAVMRIVVVVVIAIAILTTSSSVTMSTL